MASKCKVKDLHSTRIDFAVLPPQHHLHRPWGARNQSSDEGPLHHSEAHKRVWIRIVHFYARTTDQHILVQVCYGILSASSAQPNNPRKRQSLRGILKGEEVVKNPYETSWSRPKTIQVHCLIHAQGRRKCAQMHKKMTVRKTSLESARTEPPPGADVMYRPL
jgi:hypothetical protein